MEVAFALSHNIRVGMGAVEIIVAALQVKQDNILQFSSNLGETG